MLTQSRLLNYIIDIITYKKGYIFPYLGRCILFSNSGIHRDPTAILEFIDLYLLRDIFLQFFSVADDPDEFIFSGKIDQYIHGTLHGSPVQRSKSFINKQRIHLNASEIG